MERVLVDRLDAMTTTAGMFIWISLIVLLAWVLTMVIAFVRGRIWARRVAKLHAQRIPVRRSTLERTKRW
jgi:hypothetical protein